MPRIRTIKPEFPQSESMGNVSRDARLCFVLLWTLADDEGRLRGNSRMLASLLYPYDDDAPGLIDGWLRELEAEGCVVRYQVDGTAYLEIAKWLSHQKIDRPSTSKFPPSSDGSRILANPRELSPLDQGSRIKEGIKDHGKEMDQGRDHSCAAPQSDATPEKVETAFQSACKATWKAYSDAYAQRHSAPPLRDAKTNSQVRQFVKRVGQDEAPGIAGFFISHNDAFYVRKKHDFGLLLADAAKLRTEWLTGQTVTAHQAQQIDRTQTNLNAFAPLLAEARKAAA